MDRGHRGYYSGYDYDDHDHSSIAAAIVASKNKNRQDDRDVVPNWLVGRFEGYNTGQHADVAMQVSARAAPSPLTCPAACRRMAPTRTEG